VDDFSAGGTKGKEIGRENTLLIRAAVDEVAAMSRTLSCDGFEFVCVNPAIPHNARHPSNSRGFQNFQLLNRDAIRHPDPAPNQEYTPIKGKGAYDEVERWQKSVRREHPSSGCVAFIYLNLFRFDEANRPRK
jgi:hypothetical protein